MFRDGYYWWRGTPYIFTGLAYVALYDHDDAGYDDGDDPGDDDDDGDDDDE